MQLHTTELGAEREHFQTQSLIFARREAALGINRIKQILHKLHLTLGFFPNKLSPYWFIPSNYTINDCDTKTEQNDNEIKTQTGTRKKDRFLDEM